VESAERKKKPSWRELAETAKGLVEGGVAWTDTGGKKARRITDKKESWF